MLKRTILIINELSDRVTLEIIKRTGMEAETFYHTFDSLEVCGALDGSGAAKSLSYKLSKYTPPKCHLCSDTGHMDVRGNSPCTNHCAVR